MDDPRLLTLLTIIKIKNYTRTAQVLYITQPAVTNHIKSLEHQYNVELFKDKKNFELTEQGRILVEYARRMRNQSRELEEAISNSLLSHRAISLGMTEACQGIVSKKGLLNILFETYHAEANLSVLGIGRIFDDLKAGKMDFAIIDSHYDDDLFDSMQLTTYHIVPVCYVDGKFKEIKRLTRAMIKSNPIIFGNEEEGMTRLAKKAIQSANIHLSSNNVSHANSFYLMGQLIEQLDGIGFMYEELIDLVPNVKKMDVLNFEGHQNIYFLYSQNSFDKATIRSLMRSMRLWMKN